jgi:predicted DsbA family dithiol-disulfide isomerase
MKKLRVEVWSDVVCPWCYLGKRRLSAALSQFPHRDSVEVVWRSFELDPSAPAIQDPNVSYRERLAKKYGVSVERAEQMIRDVTDLAAADGLEYRLDRSRRGNTFNAHRLLHLAADRGVEDALAERFFRGYMTEGEAIGDPDTLMRLASEIGLDAEEARRVLSSDAYASEVRADEDAARAIGVTGVPFFLLAGRYGMSGAQPAELFLRTLSVAWDAIAESSDDAAIGGATCGPAGCD